MEERLLRQILEEVQGVKSGMAEMKSEITGMKVEMAEMKSDVRSLKEGQIRLEGKADKAAEAQVQDTYKLLELTYGNIAQVQKNLGCLQNDLTYLVQKMMDNTEQVRKCRVL